MDEGTQKISFERIPKHFQCGGQTFEVRMVERCDDNSLGMCMAGKCAVEIAEKYNRHDIQHPDSRINTFYHELTHAILINMGYDELNADHKFVCSFSALLTEAMRDARFVVDTNCNQ